MGDAEENLKKSPGAPIPVRVTDRRPRFEALPGQPASEESPREPRYPSFVKELEARATAAETKLSEALDLLRRRESEADDFRARLRREMEKRSRAQVENTIREFLEVLDNLDRGMAAASEGMSSSLGEGIAQVRDQILSLLARQGVEPMRLLGMEYDPHLAEAVAISPVREGQQDNKIVEELRRGFTMEGRVLRPAQVRIARRSPDATHPEATRDESPS